MYINGFSVRIPQGFEQNGYILMKHETVYTIRLRNTREELCDAYVEIDGQYVGTWQIEPKSSLELEHPANDDGRFTFYTVSSKAGKQANLPTRDPNLGLIRVTFTPELASFQGLSEGVKFPTSDAVRTYWYGRDPTPGRIIDPAIT